MIGFAIRSARIFGHHDVDESFTFVELRQDDLQVAAAVRRQVFHFQQLTRERFAFGAHFNAQGVVIESGEPQFVFHPQFAAADIPCLYFHRGDDLLVFAQARPRRLVGENQTIETEVVVVRVVAIIAAEFVPHRAVIVAGLNPVVAPFPHVVALDTVVLVKNILIFS